MSAILILEIILILASSIFTAWITGLHCARHCLLRLWQPFWGGDHWSKQREQNGKQKRTFCRTNEGEPLKPRNEQILIEFSSVICSHALLMFSWEAALIPFSFTMNLKIFRYLRTKAYSYHLQDIWGWNPSGTSNWKDWQDRSNCHQHKMWEWHFVVWLATHILQDCTVSLDYEGHYRAFSEIQPVLITLQLRFQQVQVIAQNQTAACC